MRSRKLNVGILAHVDAGKTTLAEAILYRSGRIRSAGRVDHGDAYLDTYELEKERGITIFSKMAQLQLGEREITLLDTPGHVDFSAEMERTLQVMDLAILVVSAPDGVQGHTMTLWRLLRQYDIPVFLFINKMDQPGTDREAVMKVLQQRLDANCLAFGSDWEDETFQEELAMHDDYLTEQFLEGEPVTRQQAAELINDRSIFPCFFGSALKMEGVDEFLQGLEQLTVLKDYPDDFGARVYKIARDTNGTRLTYLKITGGSLKVRQIMPSSKAARGSKDDAKIDQIRIYSGKNFEAVQEAAAGEICAVTGLADTFAGEGLGREKGTVSPLLEPVLTYAVVLPDGTDMHEMFLKLKALEEEIPELNLVWMQQTGQIQAQVMGEVQIEILKTLIRERFGGIEAQFDAGRIVYKETIRGTVEGVGHFEPLRHYSEVHLLIEEGERGSGVQFDTNVSTDDLALNWQRLILTHLMERTFPGVLTGSELTDVKITLAAGRAHIKHTEGGDFRQSTYRAVRQGLMKAESVLLEPIYAYTLEIPSAQSGRAMTDIRKMNGTFDDPKVEDDMTVLTGFAPVSTIREYQKDVTAYTSGRGRLMLQSAGYEPCHNAEEVIREIAYDPEADIANPASSVFCGHGSSFVVPWKQVEEYMHLESALANDEPLESDDDLNPAAAVASAGASGSGNSRAGDGRKRMDFRAMMADDAELQAIFERTYGSKGKKENYWKRSRSYNSERTVTYTGKKDKYENKEAYLLVDGYNIIFSWQDLYDLSKVDLGAARGKLMDILSNYQGYRGMNLILVFDAWKVQGGPGEVWRYHNIDVVYTKEAETADAYIEKTSHALKDKGLVTVATSDAAEQVIIFGQGAVRMSASELREEIQNTCKEIQHQYLVRNPGGKHYLFDDLDADMAALLEETRLGGNQ